MHILLILVLFGDPSGADAAKAVGAELSALGGTSVQLVVGADAVTSLAAKGVKEADLVGSAVIANHLTASDPDLVVIRLEHRVDGGDQLIESRVWFGGRAENHVAISGHGGDPTASAVAGIIQVLGPRLPLSPGQPVNADGGQLAHLAEHSDWQAMRTALLAVPNKDPRQFYYLVLAELRLGLGDAARQSLEAMRQAHGTHFLVKAAASLLPDPALTEPAKADAPASAPGSTPAKPAPGAVTPAPATVTPAPATGPGAAPPKGPDAAPAPAPAPKTAEDPNVLR
jgi:hypothetical protein